ncbi:hypothetical protein PFHG_03117 [Plasmodium falciparum HB3]|uniref:Histone H2A C-terminal domain-containing protein n=1 Tax=Plasmodium falciparum (isolate HB3) TaxID=137071 RepID=A0A0L7KE50_PLAFX|nr:hypothetical protein PFHG_03117 [Plasmodium falciparum HB3]
MICVGVYLGEVRRGRRDAKRRKGDEELDTLINATIAGGGVIPHIHKALMNKVPLPPTAQKKPKKN